MIIGTSDNSALEYFYFIAGFGQSNLDGGAQTTRLQNTQFNYKGIAAGYPATKTTQAAYGNAPANVHIYNKPGATQFSDFTTDNTGWEAYNVLTNSRFDSASVPKFGWELSLGTQLSDAGKEVGFVKAGFGGTALITFTTSQPPGTWNCVSREVAIQYLLKRAARDLKTYKAGKRVKPLCKVWWQGETDGINGATKADYKTHLDWCLRYIDKHFKETFVIDGTVPWMLVLPSYNRNAAEEVIRTAITEFAASNADCHIINVDAYPRKTDLTTAEASPLTKGMPNADGGNDDNHQSYIAQLAAGELIFQKLQELSLI
jgi:hypothetical protein